MKRTMLAFLLLAGCFPEPKSVADAAEMDARACHYFNQHDPHRMDQCYAVVNHCIAAHRDGYVQDYNACMKAHNEPR